MLIPESLEEKIVGRQESLFLNDLSHRHQELVNIANDAEVLVIGAAGTIGAAFVKELLRFGLRSLVLIDPDENGLVRLVREIRSSGCSLPDEFETYALCLGTREFDECFASLPSITHIANFAALKHVRSERDPFTLMRMIETNALALDSLAKLAQAKGVQKLFSVSSDKACHPQNALGASKLLMERILEGHALTVPYSCARFANVAFSSASLLESFLDRINLGQPLAAPSDVRRYFMSRREAGELCLLTAFLGGNHEIFCPKLYPSKDLKTFSEIAALVLEHHGYVPRLVASEDEALEISKGEVAQTRAWPCLFLPSDTTGEKDVEEFFVDGENPNSDRFESISVLTAKALSDGFLSAVRSKFETLRSAENWNKRDFIAALQAFLPEFQHTERNRHLGQKM